MDYRRSKEGNEDHLHRRIQSILSGTLPPRSILASDEVIIGSSIGTLRESNQDRAIVICSAVPSAPSQSFIIGALSDGVGGMSRGDDAAILSLSTFTVCMLREYWLPFEDRLVSAAYAANNSVHNSLKGRGGATLSAVLLGRDGTSIGLNVGDSRIYQIDESQNVLQASRDDTLGEYLSQSPKLDLETHKTGQLIQFIGIGEGLEPHIVQLPHHSKYSSFLLTTDGIHDMNDRTLSAIVKASPSSYETVRRLIYVAEFTGGHDNATAICLPAGLAASSIFDSAGIKLWTPAKQVEILWSPDSVPVAHSRTITNTEVPNTGSSQKKQKSRSRRPKRSKSTNATPPEQQLKDPDAPSNQNDNGDAEPRLDIDFPDVS